MWHPVIQGKDPSHQSYLACISPPFPADVSSLVTRAQEGSPLYSCYPRDALTSWLPCEQSTGILGHPWVMEARLPTDLLALVPFEDLMSEALGEAHSQNLCAEQLHFLKATAKEKTNKR